MKTLAFILGVFCGALLLALTVKPMVITKTEYVARTVKEPCEPCKPCADCKAGLSPSYVLDLLKECRAGKLDQSHPDITVRQ